MKFSDYLINESLITFGNKSFPKHNNVVIMAGGAGSGKGFVKDKVVGIDGKVFDVDELKKRILKSKTTADKIKNATGVDIKTLDLRKPEDVSTLHFLISSTKLDKKYQETFFSTIDKNSNNKPNLIFDVTLKDMKKLQDISKNVQELGYKKEDIHIVWVVQDFDVAIKQNAGRDRVVSPEIMKATHTGAYKTMLKIMDVESDALKYMNGDIWVCFNKKDVDSKFIKSEFGGSYFKDFVYFKTKAKGKSPINLPLEFEQKIEQYTQELR